MREMHFVINEETQKATESVQIIVYNLCKRFLV